MKKEKQKMTNAKQNINASLQKNFAASLLEWDSTGNQRQMPWKGEKDPYRIWLSEIILQQTRVEQGLQYYQRFVQTFPTIKDLADSPEQQVFKLWEGLGYYTRCKNLIQTAKYISEKLNGVFPDKYEAILALKGVGNYTAAAIASFAYNLPYAVLDGNVFRVLSRIFDIETPIDTTEGKKLFAQLAQEVLPKGQSAAYNQALMDFGATICKPVPECAHCFFNKYCKAYQQKKQLILPVKSKQVKTRERWFHYILLQHENTIAIHQRAGKDIWQSLYEPLLIEAPEKLFKENILTELGKMFGLFNSDYEVISAAANTTQKLTHQYIHFFFLHLSLHKKKELPGFIWVLKEESAQYPFPKTVQEFIIKNLIG